MIRTRCLSVALVLAVLAPITHAANLIGDTKVVGRPQIAVPPEYPEEALAKQITGKLRVEMNVGISGKVRS
ncbi:hypothetical protein [Chitinimonas sp.]|uniref:hypothetical protein n=1 Tax=Chitinimonas sp. TaxID=1934313 RepID=UPI002F936F72